MSDPMINHDPAFLRTVVDFIFAFLGVAFIVALGSILSIMRHCGSLSEFRPKISRLSLWANYCIVLIGTCLTGTWVTLVAFQAQGMQVLIPSAVTFFAIGLAVEDYAERIVARAANQT